MLESFKQLGLSAKTLEALEKKGFEKPSQIQAAVIPLLLGNTKNIIGQAQTWTGKTAAFGIPLIEKIKPIGHVQAIILVPTRELAVQVAEEISSLQTTKTLQVTPIYGGQSYDIQNRLLKKWTDIVVGTPGRVIDHISRKTLKIEDISYFILDEADEMLNMGFIDDIEDIFKHTNKDKRVLLFSATMPKEILNVARKYMGEYELVSIKKDQLTSTQTEQIYFEVNERDKLEALIRVIDMEENFYGIVFCKTKMDVDHLTAKLNEKWHFVQALHGDVQQKQRENILKLFKAKKTKIIIATDVAARGIDVNDISHVINYSLPQDPESYIHRIGRTGRADKTGIAITFITPSEFRKLVFFQRATQTTIKKGEIPAITDIIKTKKNKFQQNLNAIVESEGYKSTLEFAQQLLQDKEPDHVVAALIKIAYENEFNEHNYRALDKVQMGNSGVNNGMWKDQVRLFISLWRKAGYEARSLVEYIYEQSQVPGRLIDDVRVMDDFSFITVPFAEGETILRALKSVASRAKNPKDSGWGSRWGRSGWYRGGDRWGYRGNSDRPPRRDDRGPRRDDSRGFNRGPRENTRGGFAWNK